MKKYMSIEWNKALLWLIPPILRRSKHIIWLKTMLSPIFKIYDDTLYRMQHTGQIIYLEKMLNESFNAERNYDPNLTENEKRDNQLIYIAESLKPDLQHIYLNREYDLGYEPPMVYRRNEVDPSTGKAMYLVGLKDYTEIKYANFRIMIPETLTIDLGDLDGLAAAQKVQTLVNEIYFEDDPDPAKADLLPVEVKTPKFHELINFYKLAGKTYETYKY
ncbi:MAG: hypothetical protein AAFQ94_14350 [Bacteroidota bacterium]